MLCKLLLFVLLLFVFGFQFSLFGTVFCLGFLSLCGYVSDLCCFSLCCWLFVSCFLAQVLPPVLFLLLLILVLFFCSWVCFVFISPQIVGSDFVTFFSLSTILFLLFVASVFFSFFCSFALVTFLFGSFSCFSVSLGSFLFCLTFSSFVSSFSLVPV